MAVANRSRYELDLDNREIDLDAAALVVKGMANFMNAAAAVGGVTVSRFYHLKRKFFCQFYQDTRQQREYWRKEALGEGDAKLAIERVKL
ncbi:hypothetical protein P8452_51965 [Trifolium repens]|nr:hypothetical protein P8452_51965 [Trifolium repens]